MKIIFTCQSYPLAAREWKEALGAETASLAEGVGIADAEGTMEAIGRTAQSLPLVFTRHMFPVNWALPAISSPLALLEEIAALLDPALSFSVQARSFAGHAAPQALSEALRAKGFSLDIRHPQQIVSVYEARDALYLGVSPAAWNLSDWNGGMMHFSSRDLISRAECKLLEAMDVFSISIAKGAYVLDLGAAPGGWSHALARRGADVTAVDPADLDPRVLPLVRHVRATAQPFLAGDSARYDLIVNDMKMDAPMALDLLFRFRGRLKPGGGILSTLKLPKKGAAGVATRCLRMIRENGELLGARQLFHNRSEITVYFR